MLCETQYCHMQLVNIYIYKPDICAFRQIVEFSVPHSANANIY